MSPLAGDINWMETIYLKLTILSVNGPHSLGILIEWKRYSGCVLKRNSLSPLAGDINWMETLFSILLDGEIKLSPLAGDINWMETWQAIKRGF